jgi:hypothetical protein
LLSKRLPKYQQCLNYAALAPAIEPSKKRKGTQLNRLIPKALEVLQPDVSEHLAPL